MPRWRSRGTQGTRSDPQGFHHPSLSDRLREGSRRGVRCAGPGRAQLGECQLARHSPRTRSDGAVEGGPGSGSVAARLVGWRLPIEQRRQPGPPEITFGTHCDIGRPTPALDPPSCPVVPVSSRDLNILAGSIGTGGLDGQPLGEVRHIRRPICRPDRSKTTRGSSLSR
jgi:hypothetical protein